MNFSNIVKNDSKNIIFVFMIVASFVLLFFTIKNNRENKVVLMDVAKAQKFHYYLKEKITEITPIEGSHKIINSFDIDMNYRFGQIQNEYFDSVITHGGIVNFRFNIPVELSGNEVEEYGMYQALNSARILDRLEPTNQYAVLKITMFRKGVLGESEFNFDYKKLKNINEYSVAEILRTEIK